MAVTTVTAVTAVAVVTAGVLTLLRDPGTPVIEPLATGEESPAPAVSPEGAVAATTAEPEPTPEPDRSPAATEEAQGLAAEEEAGTAGPVTAEPEEPPVQERASQEPAHWVRFRGRAFRSVAVTTNGERRELAAGTELELLFPEEQEAGLVFYAGCNRHGGPIEVTASHLDVDDRRFGGTAVGCAEDRVAQDEWLVRFFTADPQWVLDGDELLLDAGDTRIELVESEWPDWWGAGG